MFKKKAVLLSNQSSTYWQQSIVWITILFTFLIDFYANGRLVMLFLPNFVPLNLVIIFDLCIILLSFINSIYNFVTYLSKTAQKQVKNAQMLKKTLNNSSQMLNVSSLQTKDRVTCLSSIATFLDNFLKSSACQKNDFNTTQKLNLSASYNGLEKNTSISSTIGYHNSSLNKSISTIYTQQQLDKLLSSENYESIAETSSTNIFSNSFCDEDRLYRAGTSISVLEKNDNAAKQVQDFVLSKQNRSIMIKRSISDSFKRTRENSPLSSFSNLSASAAGVGGKQRHHDMELEKVFSYYDLKLSEIEYYELKLRIWICRTILKPLIEKIDETNLLIREKFASLHLKIGSTSPDALKVNLNFRMELCSSYLPFILPYLRIHANQNYLIQRIRTLSKNVALGNFKWNSGGPEIICDETEDVSKSIPWSEKLPTDSEIVWFAFCTYMDYHLTPCPNLITEDYFKPFSNVYFTKGDSHPNALSMASDAFFIRMATVNPPVFEFVFNGNTDIITPNKENGNLWIILILFLAHVDKFNNSRIGHLHLSNIYLDIFDN